MMIEGAAAVDARKEEINDLNVFPVPDGDTGINMSLTLNAAAKELAKMQSPTLGKALEVSSSAVLRGARGNSGVITSLLFRGIAKGMKDVSTADGGNLANGLTEGVAAAYKAVLKPAEGTILTVSRIAAEAAVKAAKEDRDCEKVLLAAIEAGKVALEETTEQNPVLKKAGVVDAGGFGFIVLLEGMYIALSGQTGLRSVFMPSIKKPVEVSADAMADFSQFDTGEITFSYCTEFIAERKDKKRSPDKLREFLMSIGDSVVVVEDDEIIKVHVHTENPDKALGEGLKYGPLLTMKIENMRAQHEQLLKEAREEQMGERKVAAPENRYGFVAVAAGEGLSSVFVDLGVDNMVEGGQTMNPSTEDILNAIDATPSEVVFVLPNNKNIIMASEQAAPLSDKQVVVLPTKTIPQGLCAMLAFDPDVDLSVNEDSMNKAIQNVRTGQITYAARDSEFEGRNIKEGDFMSMADGKLVHTNKKFESVVKKLANEIADKKSSFITIIYGEGADEEQANGVAEVFQKEAKNAEIQVIFGGQPVYSYIISVE
ncbi:MAG: DAK2 domain-containing protein [Clostridia bacterium]|nr:DAK2 domain-containing protein [Clostridia bacterium]MBQ3092233.1 DAK2 domain-containing protein [Clostridia bacterium]MBQ9925803.1 DAK2 domain-containing protein [Clostridia bacterium]